MAISIADKYFVKAMDEYPYDLEAVVENLHYALSYDEEHVGALNLMALFNMEQLQNFTMAEEYFNQALAIDPQNGMVCINYAFLQLQLRAYGKIKKMLNYLHTLRGVEKAVVFMLESLNFESMKAYERALNSIKNAKMESLDNNLTSELENMQKRIEKKMKLNSPYFYEC